MNDKHIENIKKIKEMFPNCVTERFDDYGHSEQCIDFDVLKQELSDVIVKGEAERYRFTWPGKKEAILIANIPIKKALIPYDDKSIDYYNTDNLYIEGDNLDALKLLSSEYSGRIKMIYVDPPYNSKRKLIYKDDFDIGAVSWKRLKHDGDNNGRYHIGWLNYMYPRLKLARELLTDDGAIFLSIDDTELLNLKYICNEIFGEDNFVGQYMWYKSSAPTNMSKKIKSNVEYILCYEKKLTNKKYKGLDKSDNSSNGMLNNNNKYITLKFPKDVVESKLPDGIYFSGTYGTPQYDIELLDDVTVKDGIIINEFRLHAKFKWSQENLIDMINTGTKIIIKTESFFPFYEKCCYDPEVPPNLIDKKVNVDTVETAVKELQSLFDGVKVFDAPKPTSLMEYLINFICEPDDIILDLFAGSATTAHAVMSLNAKDGGKRKYIMVQLPEQIDENSNVFKAGFKTISDIGTERIRRAGIKIKSENPEIADNLDTGFRFIKITDI